MPLGQLSDTGSGIELAISDPSQLSPLREWLRGQPGVEVSAVPGRHGPGELGVVDVLSMLGGSSVLVAAIKTLPDFIRSRRRTVRIETTINGHPFVLDAANVDEEVAKILEKLLDE
jgi:Effector Associated Constant Component 1